MREYASAGQLAFIVSVVRGMNAERAAKQTAHKLDASQGIGSKPGDRAQTPRR